MIKLALTDLDDTLIPAGAPHASARAMEAIHRRMLQRRDQGSAILLVSSELTEIMSLSDRIYVIFEGKIVGEFTRGSMDDKHLGLLMVGGTINHE